MRLRQQFSLTSQTYIPDHASLSISRLIDHGLITDVTETGFPLYTPIGSALLENIEAVFSQQARLSGFDLMRLPNAMRTDVLAKGQELGEQFRSKLMHLTGDLQSYHVMSTPEMLFVQWARQYHLSRGQLPIALYYLDELHRQMHYTRGSLISRQIRVFGGFVLEEKSLEEKQPGSRSVRDMVAKALNDITLPYHLEEQKEFDYEFYYICPMGKQVQEGENIVLPGLNNKERTKAFSLGMVYEYPMNNEWRLRYRDDNNKNKKPTLLTFGVCTHRVLYCLLINTHDEKGFALPRNIRPFDITVIPRSGNDMEDASKIYEVLSSTYNLHSMRTLADRVALDDRIKLNVDTRAQFSDYIGTGAKIIVSSQNFSLIDRSGNTLETDQDINAFMNRAMAHRI